MIYYRRYVADYLVKTIGLSMIEDGAYGRLLDYYYQTEKPLPKDLDQLYEIARATRPEDRKAVKRVVETKFTMSDDGYHNRRADTEIQVSKQARDNGHKGGRPARKVTETITGM